MAYTLAQAAVIAPNPLTKGVIQTIADNPLFNDIPFINVDGNAYSYTRTASLGDAEFRAINGAYTESTPTFSNHVVALKPLGGDADVDEFLIRTQSASASAEDLMAAAVVAKSQAVRQRFVKALINGDVDTNPLEFDGLEEMGLNEVTGPAGSFGSTSDSRQDMFDALDELLASVNGANALIARPQAIAAMKSAARREGVLTDADNFGRTIASYAGVPLLSAGNDEDGSPILTTDDIYAVRFDAQNGVAAVTNGGIQVRQLGELDVKPSRRVRIEFYCAAVMLHPDAAAVLRATAAP